MIYIFVYIYGRVCREEVYLLGGCWLFVASEIPRRYRAALFYDYKQPFRVEEVDMPEIKGEQVLVRTIGCGLCHSDLHIWFGEFPGVPVRRPAVLGHEASGIVVAKGDAVPDRVKVGMPVLVNGLYPLEESIYALKGENNLVLRALNNIDGSLGLYGGCYAEYFVVPDYRYLISAEGLDDLAAAAPLSDAGLTPYRAVKKALDATRMYAEADDFIVVVGVGGLGTFGAQYVNILAPYLNLIVVDARDEALEFVSKLANVHTSINAKRENPLDSIRRVVGRRKVMAVVDFVGSDSTVSTYINALSPGGAYVVVGLGGAKASFPLSALVLREWKIIGNYGGSVADLRELVQLARKGLVKYREVVTKRWSLEEINEGFEALRNGVYMGRTIVVP